MTDRTTRVWLVTLSGILSFLFGCDRASPYEKRGDIWYYNDDAMRVAPGETLTPLSSDFATAGSDAFYRASPIGGADGRTFRALSDHYAKDAKAVFYADTHRKGQEYFMIKHTRVRVLTGADAATFEYLDHHYARDARSVYHAGERFDVADPASFEPLGYGHARDRVHGYYMQKPISGSDGSSFSALSDNYSKDGARVYYSRLEVNGGAGPAVVRSTVIPGADPATFATIDVRYVDDSANAIDSAAAMPDAADARASYRKGERIRGSPPAVRP